MKKGIIVTSFGTTYKKTRQECIRPTEDRMREIYPDSLILRAFTSRMVIKRLKERDGYHVDNPSQALERMKDEGIKDISIQPLLIIEGIEYEKILREAEDFSKANKGFKITVGKPLLSSDKDYDRVVEALDLDRLDLPLVLMGHGSDHETDLSYKRLEDRIRDGGYRDVFIGTLEGKITIKDIIGQLKEKNIDKVSLKAFMLVAGDHAINDMASDDEDSWKSILNSHGIKAEIEIRGLGQEKKIQDIFIGHLEDIKDS